MKSWFSRRPAALIAGMVLSVVLVLMGVQTAWASVPGQQYQSEPDYTFQIYYCVALLIIAVPIAIWGRNKIRSDAQAAGSFNTTLQVRQPPDVIQKYINKNYDRSSKGGRDWDKKWTSKNPPKGKLSTWYPKYWSNCLFMILMGIIPYLVLREVIGGRSEKIFFDVTPGEGGGSVVKLNSEGKIGYEEAQMLADKLNHL